MGVPSTNCFHVTLLSNIGHDICKGYKTIGCTFDNYLSNAMYELNHKIM